MFKFSFMKGSGVFTLGINDRVFFHLFIRYKEDVVCGYQKFLDPEFDGNFYCFGLHRLAMVAWY